MADQPNSTALRVARRRLRLTRARMAATLGISERTLAYYENGRTVPRSVMLAVGALAGGRSAGAELGRERWVGAVDHLLRYGRGEPVAGRLLRERRLRELADMLALARQGPHPDMALTDPPLFRALRDAATRAYLAGLLRLHLPAATEPPR